MTKQSFDVKIIIVYNKYLLDLWESDFDYFKNQNCMYFSYKVGSMYILKSVLILIIIKES